MDMVFYYIANEIPSYAQYFIASVRKTMPDTKIWQLTDFNTPEIPGVDEVKRFKTGLSVNRDSINYIGYQFLSEMELNPVVFVDPDMIFNGSIEHLYEGDYDICVAMRALGDATPIEWAIKYPYCSFMVVKNAGFWKDCYNTMLDFPVMGWFDNMEAVAKVIHSGKYKVKRVDGSVYNAMPLEYDKEVKVYHCKLTDKAIVKECYDMCEQEGRQHNTSIGGTQ
jgi:hypothetical protein